MSNSHQHQQIQLIFTSKNFPSDDQLFFLACIWRENARLAIKAIVQAYRSKVDMLS